MIKIFWDCKCIKLLFFLISLLLTSCYIIDRLPGTGSSYMVKRAPYYHGHSPKDIGKVGHFSIVLDIRNQHPIMRSKMAPILDLMNHHLDSLVITQKLPPIKLSIEDAPDIYVGQKHAYNAPTYNTFDADKEEAHMVLAEKNPSKKWKKELLQVMTESEVDHSLFITIGISSYFLRQKNLFGSKVLELGTGYNIPIGWLKGDLDTPHKVFHITGTLLNKEGITIRSGAEGISAKKTGFLGLLVGSQTVLTNADLKKFTSGEIRKDLPGSPANWKVAIQNLVAQLLERNDLIIK